MKLGDMTFRDLLPAFMREDGAILGLSFATDAIVQKLHASAQLLTTWDKIDELPEKELDRLAEELHITWYLKSEPIDVKRNLIKNSDQVYQKLGTKWAVENVIHTYFGDGYIQEWFQYEGEPGHFRIFSANPSITDERLMQFLEILQKVKRGSSHLDGIFITLTGRMQLHTGVGYHEVSFETIRIGGNFKEKKGEQQP